MKRKGSAVWQGGLKDGKGVVSTDSGVLSNTQYSFNTRFEDGKGTNPEELIAAAHAGCFSMALSAQLGGAGITPEQISTTATVSLDKTEGGFAITAIHLDVAREDPRRRQAGVRDGRQQREVRLSRIEGVERDDYDGRHARDVSVGGCSGSG